MAALKQVGSVDKYVQGYEKFIAKLSSMPEEQCLGYFLNGLSVEIKWWVWIHELEDLNHAIQLVEDELVETQVESYVT